MRVLAVVHGLWRGGAQEATLEMLSLLKRRGIDIRVLTCDSAEGAFLSDVKNLGIPTFTAPGRIVADYPDLAVEKHAELVKSSEAIWITDVEYLVAPRIKRIKGDMPIIAHLHSYALACPIWSAFYGMHETCTENCSRSLRRFARCRQLSKQYMAHWHRRSTRMKVYQLLNFPKSYLDFVASPMNEVVVESMDGFVAVSQFSRDLVRTHLPSLEDVPVEVIPNPVMMPEPSMVPKDYEDGGDMSVLYASGADVIKGPHIALYATRKLLDEGSEFTLTMLKAEGDAWIRSLVRRLRIGKRVRLLPALPRTQVSTLMANSAVVLTPSLGPETFCRVPIEANLVGTPAIVSNRGALLDGVIDKVTGLVTEPSVEAFAKSVDDALRAEWNRELIVRTAKRRFEPERIVDDFIHFLETFI